MLSKFIFLQEQAAIREKEAFEKEDIEKIEAMRMQREEDNIRLQQDMNPSDRLSPDPVRLFMLSDVYSPIALDDITSCAHYLPWCSLC